MKKKLLALVLTVAMTIIGVKQVTTGPSTFDKLLELAVAADVAYDLEEEWAPKSQAELHNFIIAVLYQFAEEGFIGDPHYPTGLASLEYGAYRSSIAGTYSPAEDVVGLNIRYFTDPSWMSQDWLATLIHELVHAQGFMNEAQTETLTQETIASMANLGYPGLRRVLLDNLRRDALAAAYYIAYYGGEFSSTTAGAGGVFSRCAGCGDDWNTNQAQVDKWATARASVFTSEELRRADARLRYWQTGERANNYPYVLDAYVVRPMAGTTEAACREGNLLGEQYVRVIRRLAETRAVGPYRMDDFAYVLKDLGWTC